MINSWKGFLLLKYLTLGQVTYILCISISFQTGEHESIFSLILVLILERHVISFFKRLFYFGAQLISSVMSGSGVQRSHSVNLF